MATKPEAKKAYEQRIVYRLLVADEDAPPGHAKPKRVVCTYHNGVRIHGHAHQAHPAVVVSAKDQDEILWVGAGPFEIELELASGELGPANPFYRPPGQWKASKGNDGVWRLASGPVNPVGLLAQSAEYKFSAYALDSNGARKDDSEPLDPHIIVEP